MMAETSQRALTLPTLYEVRRLAMEDALNRSFQNGQLRMKDRKPVWGILHKEIRFAAFAADEFADAQGPFAGDERLRDDAVAALTGAGEYFDPQGTVAGGDMNTGYFALVPYTRALMLLKGKIDSSTHGRLVDRARKLFAGGEAHINRTHEYLNPRGLEAVSAYGLYQLTNHQPYLDRAIECLDQLLTRQYASGAQPYHTGHWVWGRKPAQAYQFLTANLMLYLGQQLKRNDAIEYVRRVADFSLMATNRRGEAFCTTFEGLHKSSTLGCVDRQWPMACALGDDRFKDLARRTYELWVKSALNFMDKMSENNKWNMAMPAAGYLSALIDARMLGVEEVPQARPFVPKSGTHLLADISAVLVHEPGLDISMSLLGGYTAFAEADCGDIKLFALTPELTDNPTFSNAGTDAMREDWRVPSEQIECISRDGKSVLRGRVYTKWEKDRAGEKDLTDVHNRLLEVSMTYADGELLLEYQTIKNTQRAPVSSRLLFLLIARPANESPRLRIDPKVDIAAPPASSTETFFLEAPIGTVQFSSPDGSMIEIIPEESLAEKITAERPIKRTVGKGGNETHLVRHAIKQANEGSLRLAFEGMNVLDRGRYRIRFLPAR